MAWPTRPPAIWPFAIVLAVAMLFGLGVLLDGRAPASAGPRHHSVATATHDPYGPLRPRTPD